MCRVTQVRSEIIIYLYLFANKSKSLSSDLRFNASFSTDEFSSEYATIYVYARVILSKYKDARCFFGKTRYRELWHSRVSRIPRTFVVRSGATRIS